MVPLEELHVGWLPWLVLAIDTSPAGLEVPLDDLHGLQEEMSEALVLLEVPEPPEVPQVPENLVRLVGRPLLHPTWGRAGKLEWMEPLNHWV